MVTGPHSGGWRVIRYTDGNPTPDRDLHKTLDAARVAAGWPEPGAWTESAGCLILTDRVLDEAGTVLSPVAIEEVHAWPDAPVDLSIDPESAAHRQYSGVPIEIPDEAVDAASFTAAGALVPPECRREYVRAMLRAAAPAIITANRPEVGSYACADWCCAKGCPGLGNALCEAPPCDGTRCTCGHEAIRAILAENEALKAAKRCP
jgi:hypothetical protein